MPHVKVGELDSDSKFREAMEFDVTDEQVKSFTIGEKVEVIIKGSVGLLQVPPDGSSKMFPSSLGLRVTSKKIVSQNAFEKLAEEDEDDD